MRSGAGARERLPYVSREEGCRVSHFGYADLHCGASHRARRIRQDRIARRRRNARSDNRICKRGRIVRDRFKGGGACYNNPKSEMPLFQASMLI